ncbi:sensor histidine kinase [Actinomadura roseirufa]|uniref:sensor histidine kinase n=1 Tax=Actinomadura roseirufa TaxID=2094049 RepID=UPI0010414A29|nr:ATP-binding protein [Actinomadura roseirufa]
MPQLTTTPGRDHAAVQTRLAVTFRLLLLLRGLLLAMAVVLLSTKGPDPGLGIPLAVFALETALACAAWRSVLPVVQRMPLLCCADALMVFAVLAEGGVFGPFFLFSVMTAAIAGVLYRWGPVLLVCVAQICLCYVAMTTGTPVERHAPGLLVALPVFYPLAACAGVMLRALFDQYAESEEARRSAETAAATAEERTRLAREMHDSLAKTLQGITMSVATLPIWIRKCPERAEQDARDILSALEVAAREARGLIADLRDEAYVMALPTAVRRVAAEWGRNRGVNVHVEVSGRFAMDVPVAVRYELVSVLKEALTNVERHADAGRVEIRLIWSVHAVMLTVRDDGAGFVPPVRGRFDLLARDGHYGLVGMAERARRVGGRLALRSAPGGGTTLTITVPHVRDRVEGTPEHAGFAS